MSDPKEILETLDNCLRLLDNAADADEAGNFEEMMANLAAMAPQLQRARNNLALLVEDREGREVLDVVSMDEALSEIDMTWGYTKTNGNSPFIADEVCMARRSVCDPEFLDQIEASERGRQAPSYSVKEAWNRIIEGPTSLLSWEGIEGEKAVFSLTNGDRVTADAGRVACLRTLSLFNKAKLALEEPEAILFYQTGDPTPVSVLLTIDR